MRCYVFISQKGCDGKNKKFRTFFIKDWSIVRDHFVLMLSLEFSLKMTKFWKVVPYTHTHTHNTHPNTHSHTQTVYLPDIMTKQLESKCVDMMTQYDMTILQC